MVLVIEPDAPFAGAHHGQAEEVSNCLDTSGYLKISPFFHRRLGHQLFY